MRRPFSRSKNRRGAEAVEFALVIPVMLLMVFGSIDYGWYFWNQALATNVCLTGMRAGGLVRPTDTEIENGGSCAACLTTSASRIRSGLISMGVSGVSSADVTPTLVGIDGACTMVLDVDIPYTRITPNMFSVPTSYNVALHVLAQGASGC